jgi:hypothetical protein
MRDSPGLDLLRSHDFPNRYSATLGAKFIMSFFGFLSSPDSQKFALSRRELLGKSLAIGAVSLLSKPQPKFSYPLPEFNIGDLVSYYWEPDPEDDDAPECVTDFGQVLGMRYVLEPESSYVLPGTWLYYIMWTHSTCDGTEYPYYDQEPTRGCDLRLIKQS